MGGFVSRGTQAGSLPPSVSRGTMKATREKKAGTAQDFPALFHVKHL
jgi:hypothetical protein